ncbi:MAG: DegT/DnrJ/EryC1/StrS aminotransferase family protein [Spirochaetia bacterium]|nr:DegT/DnrJ/EryC1/StrS aminotransferase family protein [Spirochaetia bacterium]
MALASVYRTEKKIQPIEAQRPTLSKDELESVLDCLIHDRLLSGNVTGRFEKSFAHTFNFKHALGVNSPTSAYHLAFLALGLGQGDLVCASAIAPVGIYDAARYVGADVTLVDLERNSFHPSSAAVQAVFAASTAAKKVYVLDHTFGAPAALENPGEGVQVIADVTGVVGSDVAPEMLGIINICGLSQYDLITTGNGAMILSQDSKLHSRLEALRYGGKRSEGSVAYDYRMEDFQAAMGLDQLTNLSVSLARRRKIGMKYLESLTRTNHETYFKTPNMDSYLRFPVIVNKQHDEVVRYFAALQIGITRSVDQPLHHVMGLPRLEYPNAERLYQKSVAIPVYPALSANNVERIAQSLRGLV